jgi:haloacid dehalogenase-like hydrolase
VANAAPEVLEAADEVTAANTDDGVALLLERILAADGGGVSARPWPARGTGRGR